MKLILNTLRWQACQKREGMGSNNSAEAQNENAFPKQGQEMDPI